MRFEEKTIQYSLARKDILIFNIYGGLRQRSTLLTSLVIMAFLIYLPFHTPPAAGHPEPSTTAKLLVGLTLGIIGLLAMLLIFLLVALLLGSTRNLRNILGQYEMKLSNDGMMTRGATSETFRKWDGLLKLTSTKNYLFLFVTGTSAQIIPKRCFASPAEAQAVEQIIRERMKRG